MRTTTSSVRTVARIALRHDLQQLVAGLVAARVVDVLETIEVEEQHREHGACAPRLLDGSRQMRREEQPVRQAGELVVMREVVEMLLLLQQLRFDLAHHAAMFGLLDELAMLRLRLGDAGGEFAHAQLERNRPRCDGAKCKRGANG